MRKLAPVLVIVALLVLSSGCLRFGEDEPDPEQEMRDLVQRIGSYGRETDPGFTLIVVNGEDLSTKDGGVASGYVTSIDGVARENLFFGWNGMDKATPWDVTQRLSDRLNVSKAQGKVIMAVDRCSQRGFVWDSMEWAQERGFLYFAANSEGMDTLPEYPKDPPDAHNGDVTSLREARNLLVVTAPVGFDNKTDYLKALRHTRHDVLVIDAWFNSTPLTPDDVDSLRTKAGGGQRLVIAVMGLGEIDERWQVWNEGWSFQPPAWVKGEVPGKPGVHRVDYTSNGWRTVLYKSEGSWMDVVLGAGFDGVYLMGGDACKDI